MEGRTSRSVPIASESRTWQADADLQGPITAHKTKNRTWLGIAALAYASMGVVYGDIGTSPLYVYDSIFAHWAPSQSDVLGAMSLIFWTMTLITLVKYTCIVLCANDDGEGGTFAMYTLLCRTIGIAPHGSLYASDRVKMLQLATMSRLNSRSRSMSGSGRYISDSGARTPWYRWGALSGSKVRRWFRSSQWAQRSLFVMSIIATAMVLGDGVLTPAISVMSAVSGLKVASSAINQDVVVGVACGILVLLFSAQQFGTGKVSITFAPIVVLWLVCNAAAGIYQLARHGGEVFKALSPAQGIDFLVRNGFQGWEALGGVMLCVTGAEAMFLDMGHFSHAAISTGFGLVAYPCLMLTYLGQAAFLLVNLDAIGGPLYFRCVPSPVFYPMLILATLASIVASQALISGAFSLVRQASTLGAFPRLRVVHTGEEIEGQVYIAPVNWVLMLLCIAVVAGFQDTTALGNAYGTAVMAVMVITTLLTVLVMITCWELSILLVLPFAGVYLAMEGAFLSATLTKVPQGAWLTLAMAAVVSYLKLVWWAGTSAKRRAITEEFHISVQDLFAVHSQPGTGPAPEAPTPEPARIGAVATSTEIAAGSVPISNTDAGAPVPARSRFLRLSIVRSDGMPNLPVAQLKGLGVYYAESPVGVPPVLVHFLRNVQAIHEVSVFLTLRFLPVPYIQPSDRLLVRVLPGAPNFYQAIARYGYMDKVDHGRAFMCGLVAEIRHHLARHAANDGTAGHPMAPEPFDVELDAPAAGERRSQPRVSQQLELMQMAEDREVTALQGAEKSAGSDALLALSAPLQAVTVMTRAPLPPSRLQRVTTDISSAYHPPRPTASQRRAATATSVPLVQTTQPANALGPPTSATGSPAVAMQLAGTGAMPSMHEADAIVAVSVAPSHTTSSNQTGGGDSASLEKEAVAALLEALSQGVVYYVGRTSTRRGPKTPIVREVLVDTVYRSMEVMTHVDVYESWSIPLNQLVETCFHVLV